MKLGGWFIFIWLKKTGFGAHQIDLLVFVEMKSKRLKVIQRRERVVFWEEKWENKRRWIETSTRNQEAQVNILKREHLFYKTKIPKPNLWLSIYLTFETPSPPCPPYSPFCEAVNDAVIHFRQQNKWTSKHFSKTYRFRTLKGAQICYCNESHFI